MIYKLTKFLFTAFFMASLLLVLNLNAFAQTVICPPESHNYIVIESTEPTETENGTITYKCEICDSIYRETVYAYGHRWSEWKTIKNPTCTESGISERVCDITVSHREVSVIPALGHNYTYTITEPTCTTDGKKTYTCKTCGDTYEEKHGFAFGHTFLETVTTAETCEKNGEITHTCSTCGYSYTTETPALSHKYGDWVIEKQAAPGEDGSKYKECLNGCGNVIHERISALAESTSPKPTDSPTPAPTIEEPDSAKPAFGITEVASTVVNIGLIGIFFAILSGEFAFLIWRKKKTKEQKEKIAKNERDFFSKEDNYDFI